MKTKRIQHFLKEKKTDCSSPDVQIGYELSILGFGWLMAGVDLGGFFVMSSLKFSLYFPMSNAEYKRLLFTGGFNVCA